MRSQNPHVDVERTEDEITESIHRRHVDVERSLRRKLLPAPDGPTGPSTIVKWQQIHLGVTAEPQEASSYTGARSVGAKPAPNRSFGSTAPCRSFQPVDTFAHSPTKHQSIPLATFTDSWNRFQKRLRASRYINYSR